MDADGGHLQGMSEIDAEREEDLEQPEPGDEPLLEEQEGKGYGEDEGERDEALPSDAD